jgi:hypothetical protein
LVARTLSDELLSLLKERIATGFVVEGKGIQM